MNSNLFPFRQVFPVLLVTNKVLINRILRHNTSERTRPLTADWTVTDSASDAIIETNHSIDECFRHTNERFIPSGFFVVVLVVTMSRKNGTEFAAKDDNKYDHYKTEDYKHYEDDPQFPVIPRKGSHRL